MYEHFITIPFGFDTDDIWESRRWNIIRQYYDYIEWCENNAKASYAVNDQFDPAGITVSFELEQDYQNFMAFTPTCYPEFLYN